MAYDEDLANRVRELVATGAAVTEKRMFGGLAFLIGGHMSVSVSGRGGLLLRCDPAQTDALLSKPDAGPFEMRGRVMEGWLRTSEPVAEIPEPGDAALLSVGCRRPRTISCTPWQLLGSITATASGAVWLWPKNANRIGGPPIRRRGSELGESPEDHHALVRERGVLVPTLPAAQAPRVIPGGAAVSLTSEGSAPQAPRRRPVISSGRRPDGGEGQLHACAAHVLDADRKPLGAPRPGPAHRHARASEMQHADRLEVELVGA
jgi:hypothetical protein